MYDPNKVAPAGQRSASEATLDEGQELLLQE
jgi:hypothetical protein